MSRGERRNGRPSGRALRPLALACLAALLILAGCRGGQSNRTYAVRTDGVAEQGVDVIEAFGCGSCHVIPGVRSARGRVGPPLTDFGARTFIAGALPNTTENLVRWIMNPQAIEPGTAMPNLDLTEEQARDVAAYLSTLR